MTRSDDRHRDPERDGLWEPSHELLLTHVHAGTLGWITLAVVGVVTWAINLGLVGFLVGLIAESAVLKQISTPVMGIALIAAVATHVRQGEAPAAVG